MGSRVRVPPRSPTTTIGSTGLRASRASPAARISRACGRAITSLQRSGTPAYADDLSQHLVFEIVKRAGAAELLRQLDLMLVVGPDEHGAEVLMLMAFQVDLGQNDSD